MYFFLQTRVGGNRKHNKILFQYKTVIYTLYRIIQKARKNIFRLNDFLKLSEVKLLKEYFNIFF